MTRILVLLGALLAAGCEPSTPASPGEGSSSGNGILLLSASPACQAMYRCCKDIQSLGAKPSPHLDCAAFTRDAEPCTKAQALFRSMPPKLRSNLPESCLQ